MFIYVHYVNSAHKHTNNKIFKNSSSSTLMIICDMFEERRTGGGDEKEKEKREGENEMIKSGDPFEEWNI